MERPPLPSSSQQCPQWRPHAGGRQGLSGRAQGRRDESLNRQQSINRSSLWHALHPRWQQCGSRVGSSRCCAIVPCCCCCCCCCWRRCCNCDHTPPLPPHNTAATRAMASRTPTARTRESALGLQRRAPSSTRARLSTAFTMLGRAARPTSTSTCSPIPPRATAAAKSVEREQSTSPCSPLTPSVSTPPAGPPAAKLPSLLQHPLPRNAAGQLWHAVVRY